MYEYMKSGRNLSNSQLRFAALCACFSVPLFVISAALVIFEHQRCPEGASSNPDDNPYTDDNPNNCQSWYECIEHEEPFECTPKDPDAGLLIFYYVLVALSVSIFSLFLYYTRCLAAYNECSRFMGTDTFRYFLTAFIVFSVVLTLLILGLVFTVEGAHSCPSGAWKVSTHNRLYNPNDCEKCVEAADTKNCVEDYDVDSSLLEVGVVMILLCTAICCGGCWFLMFRRKMDDGPSDELMLSKKLSTDTVDGGATDFADARSPAPAADVSAEAESPRTESYADDVDIPMIAGAGPTTQGAVVEMATIGGIVAVDSADRDDEEQKEEAAAVTAGAIEEEEAPNATDADDDVLVLVAEEIEEEQSVELMATPTAKAAGSDLLKQRQSRKEPEAAPEPEPEAQPEPEPAAEPEPEPAVEAEAEPELKPAADEDIELTAEDLESPRADAEAVE